MAKLSKLEERQLRRIGPPPKENKNYFLNQSPSIKRYEVKDYGEYVKKEIVDYDVIICVASYNRYFFIENILNKLFTQKTKYRFKVILCNDGSDDIRYLNLPKKYPEIDYLKNKENYGSDRYWVTINRLWGCASKYKSHCLIQIDDDFDICIDFLEILLNVFFKIKEENNCYMGIRYHYGMAVNGKRKYVYNSYYNPQKRFQGVDGGSLFDAQFMNMLEYKLPDVTQYRSDGAGVWEYLNKMVVDLGVRIYTPRVSLAKHNGGDVSIMHPSTYNICERPQTINYIDENT